MDVGNDYKNKAFIDVHVLLNMTALVNNIISFLSTQIRNVLRMLYQFDIKEIMYKTNNDTNNILLSP
jgi:hypothetical protein